MKFHDIINHLSLRGVAYRGNDPSILYTIGDRSIGWIYSIRIKGKTLWKISHEDLVAEDWQVFDILWDGNDEEMFDKVESEIGKNNILHMYPGWPPADLSSNEIQIGVSNKEPNK